MKHNCKDLFIFGEPFILLFIIGMVIEVNGTFCNTPTIVHDAKLIGIG